MSKPTIPVIASRLVKGALLAAALISVSGVANAQSKLAVIDVEAILTNSQRGKAVLESIREFSRTKSEALRGLQEELQRLNQKFADGRLSLAEDVLAGMQKELEDKTIAARRAQDDAQRELKEMQQKKFEKVEEDILPIITAVGKEQGYTMIFNKYEGGLVYADESVDITQAVIDRFDQAGKESGS